MPGSVNILRNPKFVDGKPGPRCWVFSGVSRAVKWQRGTPEYALKGAGITLISDEAAGCASWTQVVPCQPGRYYRVEATVTCDLVADADHAGLVLAVEPVRSGECTAERRITPGLHRASDPISVCATYQVPDDVRQIKVSVGLVRARGTAGIHEVRFIRILEPDEVSHILAIPAPPFTVSPPRVAANVWVCSKAADTRPITALLAAYFGDRKVHALAPDALKSTTVKADALLLPDPSAPSSIRSLSKLVKLATNRIVVVSLSAFAQLCRGRLSLRRVEQEDDPICAKVVHASYATRGFALHDTFPYAWPGRQAGSFVQNHFRKTRELKEFCRQEGFETTLTSMCDQELTSDRAICLHKETPGGRLFVLDINPAEAAGSTWGEPTLAMHLLLSILGQTQTHLGQFVAPVTEESEFRLTIREMADRIEHVVVHDEDVPAEEVTEQLVTIGREDQSYGLPLRPKPVILVRSGLETGDVQSIYGAFVWFKQLIRTEPHPCPYVHQLASQFRLAWLPCVARWESPNGWRRTGQPAAEPMTVETDGTELAALVDIVSRPINLPKIVLPRLDGRYARYAQWLPQLINVFPPGACYALSPPEGAGFCDRDRFAWRHHGYDVQVVAAPTSFDGDTHRDVIEAGGEVVRIEIPGHDADFSAHSIHRTDLAATLIEHVIGLQFGLIAVNRTTARVQLDGLPPTAMGEALMLESRDPVLQKNASRAG